tara:strand:- start:1959 stop:3287 length:1329 start_codon:yes stop_codon:yes gene_type:complete
VDISRRNFLKLGLGIAAFAALPKFTLAATKKTGAYHYSIKVMHTKHCFKNNQVIDIMSYNETIEAPVIIARQGQPITIEVTNLLDEPTTIHWHGLRIPIEMDGVPHLSQPPILPGETFTYRFTPPDAGTYWYHSHVNSIHQLGKGLSGCFIVEESQPAKFDADIPLLLRSWRIDEEGGWLPLTTPKSFRSGTKGTMDTVNSKSIPTIEIPERSLIRLRLVNVDSTKIYKVILAGRKSKLIAIDGHPLESYRTFENYQVAPGCRIDLALRSPVKDKTIVLKANDDEKILAYLKTVKHQGIPIKRSLPQLPPNPISQYKQNRKEYMFSFTWQGGDGWTINGKPLLHISQDDHGKPLKRLKLGKSYTFILNNNTQYRHPIHLHGHIFRVIENSGGEVGYWTDTVTLGKSQTVKIAFVADNPGKWMFHCHIIEHMKTGMSGYIEVS